VSVFALHCRVCEDVAPPEPLASCRRCDGPTDVAYDWSQVGLSPGSIERGPRSMWRYHELLPVRGVTLDGPGWTPLVHAGRLSDALGVDLHLKLETANPTHSFKDRVAAVSRAVAVEHGIRTICCTSNGNLGDAVAAEAAAAGLEAIVLTPAGAGTTALACGAQVIVVDGTYDDCRRLEEELSRLFPWGFLAGSLHPYAVEGLKTIAYEIAEQLGWRAPDAVVTPAASGALLAKTAQAFTELGLAELVAGELPQLVAGQPAGCAPIAAAFDEGRPISAVRPETAVEGLAIGNPPYGDLALGAARATGGAIVAVAEDEVDSNLALLARTTGIVPDASAGVAVGALVEAIRNGTIAQGAEVVLVVTGSKVETATACGEPVPAEVGAVLARLGVAA
jgi:threonine synthase